MANSITVNSSISHDEINSILWKAFDTLRGAAEPSQYKNYVLVMLFVKYISDMQRENKKNFKLPEGCSFEELYARRNTDNLGELLNITLQQIEDANQEHFYGILRNIDFNSASMLGERKERNKRLRNLLDCLNDPYLNLGLSRIGDSNLIGDSVAYLIDDIALRSGKSAGEFFTPLEISELLAKLIEPKPGEKIYDPACGSGMLLIKCAMQIGTDDFSLYGQEVNASTWALARMNMFLHNIFSAQIECGDTLRNPRLVNNNGLMQFDAVVSNPPFGLQYWGYEEWKEDPFGRNKFGLPPKTNGDFAWIMHIIASLKNDSGRAAIVVPHGVLFRGRAEQEIRQHIMENDLLEAVISLAPNLLYATGVPISILVFRAKKPSNKKGKVLLINASTLFESAGAKNSISENTISQVILWYQAFSDVPGAVKVVPINMIAKANWNLNISHYIRPEPGDLLKNAIVSIRLGLDDYELGTDERIISSIRNLYAGLLLLFKEKLLRLSPKGSEEVLIKSQIVPVHEKGRIRFKGEGKKTIELEQIKKRFDKLGIKFEWQRVNAIQEKRNDIEHYYTKDKKSAIREVISNTFIVISDFVRNQLDEDPRDLLGLKYWNTMLSTSELYENERENCLELLKLIDWQPTGINPDDIRCSSCGSSLVAPLMPVLPKTERQYFDCRSCGQSISFNDLIAPLSNEQSYPQDSIDEMSS